MRIMIIHLFLLLGFLSAPVMAIAATLQATVDRQSMRIGESIQLTLKLQGESKETPEFSPLEKDFELLNQQHGSNIQIINGQMTRSSQWSITLMPKHTGLITIPPLHAGALQTQPLQVNVQAESSSTTQGQGEDIFLDVEVTPQDVYVQQQVLITVRLFRAVDLMQAQLSEPDVNHTIIKRLGEDATYQRQQHGKTYIVTERRYALFAQRSGKYTIPALSFTGRKASRLGLFQQPGQVLRKTSKPMVINVQGIPPDWPQGYDWLPAASVQLSEQGLKQTTIHTGDAITRTVHLQADGLLASQLPELTIGNNNKQLQQYPDQPELHDTAGPRGMIGSRQQRVAIMAAEAGDYRLPAIRLPWWNTQEKKIQWLNIPAQSIHVQATGAAHSPTPPNQNSELATATSKEEIDKNIQQDTQAAAPQMLWIYTTIVLAILWLLTLGLWLYPRFRQHQREHMQWNIALNNERAQRRKIIRACQQQQPTAVIRQLLAWAQQQFPEAAINHPLQLIPILQQLDPQWETALKDLDQHCYGQVSTWNDQLLVDLLNNYAPARNQAPPQQMLASLE